MRACCKDGCITTREIQSLFDLCMYALMCCTNRCWSLPGVHLLDYWQPVTPCAPCRDPTGLHMVICTAMCIYIHSHMSPLLQVYNKSHLCTFISCRGTVCHIVCGWPIGIIVQHKTKSPWSFSTHKCVSKVQFTCTDNGPSSACWLIGVVSFHLTVDVNFQKHQIYCNCKLKYACINLHWLLSLKLRIVIACKDRIIIIWSLCIFHSFLLDAFCTIGLGLSVKVSFLLMKAITSYSVLANWCGSWSLTKSTSIMVPSSSSRAVCVNTGCIKIQCCRCKHHVNRHQYKYAAFMEDLKLI